MLTKVNIAEKLASFEELWSPKVIGELNGQFVKVVKFQGEYVWHFHADEDEMFLVVEGEMEIHLRDGVVTLKSGEYCIVPRGIEHKPAAKQICKVLLFEPASTRNTGNVDHQCTIEPDDLEKI